MWLMYKDHCEHPQQYTRRNATQRALGQPVPQPPPIESVSQSADEKAKTEVRVRIYHRVTYSILSEFPVRIVRWTSLPRRSTPTCPSAT